jgi:DNA-binding transcriptional ArsR family regulator
MTTATKTRPSTDAARKASILLKHVSDATRLQIVQLLAAGEIYVGKLCEELNLTQPAVSHHLAVLRHGKIVEPRRQGQNNFYALTENGRTLARIVEAVG